MNGAVSTPPPVAAVAQSRSGGSDVAGSAVCADTGARYRIDPNVTRRVRRAPPPRPDLPLYRPLRIYTSDPAASRLEGAWTTVNVPYEALAPGPEGRLFVVDPADAVTGERHERADLDAVYPLLSAGYEPAPSDPRFHQQMVYAVCCNVYAAFRQALGRDIAWAFARSKDPGRLILRPHAFEGVNACYDKEAGALCFGYGRAGDDVGDARMLPGEYVFGCLSHDVVAHELTHAILDGLRSHFSVPSGPDVAAFHEAFADLIAIFQRLGYRELVRGAIARARGDPSRAAALVDLARQLGHARGQGGALREAVDGVPPRRYDAALEAHALGGVLVAAVFDAFVTVFRRKTARYLRLATGGTGVLPPGEIPAELADVLADKASRLASQFQALLIRAIDYCPPVDIRFGEYLRALVTADRDLVPDDPWAYREALIDAFLRRGIVPRGVATLSEATLLWRAPRQPQPPLTPLSFAVLKFDGDPACAADDAELVRQAHALGAHVAQPDSAAEFGLVPPDAPGFAAIGLPTVTSIRSARRVGPDGQVVFDLVAEVVQECRVRPAGAPEYPVWGGSTVILGPDGNVRYAIAKSAAGAGRAARRQEFLATAAGARYWRVKDGRYEPAGPLFCMVHGMA